MEGFEISCSDCGAVYQVKPEQAGKLMHCKCGRYLMAKPKEESLAEEAESQPIEPEFHPQQTSKPNVPREGESTQPLNLAPQKPAAPPAKKPEAVNDAPVEIRLKTPPSAPKIPTPAANVPASQAPPTEIKAKAPTPVQTPSPSTKPDKKMMSFGAGIAVIVAISAAIFVADGKKKETPLPTKGQPQAAAVQTANAQSATPQSGCANPNRLDNGTVVARSLLGTGLGKLEIDNESPTDVSVRLVDSGSLTVAWVYVQQGKTAVISTVPLGQHRVVYATGSDWDAQNLTFRCDAGFAEWEKPLDYNERSEDGRTIYGDRKITLGKAKVASITKDEFLKGHIGR